MNHIDLMNKHRNAFMNALTDKGLSWVKAEICCEVYCVYNTKDMAKKLSMKQTTIKNHISGINKTLDIKNRLGLLMYLTNLMVKIASEKKK